MADEKEKLNDSLQCHVCFEGYKVDERIWQCQSGHSICTPCRNHLSECPFCKAPYKGTRNYAIEDIVRELNDGSDQNDGVNDLPIKPSAPENYCEKTSSIVHPGESTSPIIHPIQSSSSIVHPDGSSSSIVSDELRDMVVVDVPAARRPQRDLQNHWMNCSSRYIPSNVIVGGRDHGDTPLFIGRAKHKSALLPGKVNPNYKTCYVAWNGREHEKSNFQILTNISGTWLPNSGGIIPPEAFPGGHTEDGEILYIGRAHIAGTLAIGKVHPSHGCCYVSYEGREYGERNYEIFVLYN